MLDERPTPRASPKQKVILDHLRRSIIEGKYPPGARLPTREELKTYFDVSSLTVQLALDQLVRDRFVHARPRLGTFVVDHPPHLSNYGIVFPTDPANKNEWRNFYTALSQTATVLQNRQPVRTPTYYNINGRAGGDDYHTLVADLAAHRLAGLVFGHDPSNLRGTPVLERPDVPRVAVMTGGVQARPDILTIDLDFASFFERALDFLAAKKRSRVGIITTPHLHEQFGHQIEGWVAARGMTSWPHWTQRVSLHEPVSARDVTHLMMHAGQVEHIDALILVDDAFVEHASTGLLAAAIRVPDDLDVVAHCIFPGPMSAGLPVTRLGHDAGRILQTAIELIAAKLAGDEAEAPPITKLPARFADEL